MGSYATTMAKDSQNNNVAGESPQTNQNLSDISFISGGVIKSSSSYGMDGAGATSSADSGGITNTGVMVTTTDLGALEHANEIATTGLQLAYGAFGNLMDSNRNALESTLSQVTDTVHTLAQDGQALATGEPVGFDAQKIILYLLGVGAAIYLVPKLVK